MISSPNPHARGATLLATVKDEAPFLLEWIAYHKVIGFEKFIIFSNDSTDGTTEILDALHDAGEIIHIYHEPPLDVPIVKTVSDAVLASGHLAQDDWVIWLDADEFLNIHTGDHLVSDLIAFIEAQEAAQGMCIAWRLFGSAGQDTFTGRFLSQDFTKCEGSIQTWTNDKTLFRYSPDVKRLYNHKPMMTERFWQSGVGFLSSSGAMLDPQDYYITHWRGQKPTGRISAASAGWDVAQINHYAVRTRKLTGRKRKRGRIAKPQLGGTNRYGKIYFHRFNINTHEDRTILRFEAQTLARHVDLVRQVAHRMDYFGTIRRHYKRRTVDLKTLKRHIMPDAV